MGTNRWINNYVKEFPIPRVVAVQEAPVVRIVDKILDVKGADPSADTTAEEAKIDQLVYGLYGLTDEEIGVVEGRAR